MGAEERLQETLCSLPKVADPTAFASPCRWSHLCSACARTTPPLHLRATGQPAAPTVRRRTVRIRAYPNPDRNSTQPNPSPNL